jgi:hypothetical protein
VFNNAPTETSAPSAGRLPIGAAAAVTLSITAVIVGVTYASYRSIAAQLRANGDHLNKIDPWTIYTAVYEDLLNDRKN